MQHAPSPPEIPCRHLPDQAQHSGTTRVRGRESGRSVQQAGARHDRAHTDLAGDTRVAVGHVARRLLVTCVNDADRGLEREPFEQAVELHAGKAEHDLDAPPAQPLDDELAAGALGGVVDSHST